MSLYFKPAGTSGGGGGPSPWAATSGYVVDQQVFYGGNFYNCIVAHTSGTNFVDDLALGKWAFMNSSEYQNPNLMLAFNNFEANSALGWTAVGIATVTNGLPVSVGSGGTAFTTSNGGRAKGANTTAAAVTSSGPIDGIYSLNLATSGAGTIGDGYISQSIPISIGYQAKVMVAACKFKVASGTPVMGGTSADTYAIAVYDITNNAWLAVNGAFSFTQSSGVGDCRVTFQTASTTAAVQIFIYSPIAPTGSSSLLLDNFYLGQQSVAYGSPVTDWVSYTPTGSWVSNTTYTGQWRRVGSDIEGVVKVATSGAPTSASLTVSLPSGFTIDTAKLANGSGTFDAVGTGVGNDSGTGYKLYTLFNNTTSILAAYQSSTSGNGAAVTQAAPFTFGASDYVTLTYKVPIVGWSSSVIMSSDAATNVVAAYYTGSSGTTGTASAVNTYAFKTKVYDTNNAYNTSTGAYTVPVSGYYRVSKGFSILITPTGAAAPLYIGFTYNSTSTWKARNEITSTSSGALYYMGQCSATIQCSAGDTIYAAVNNGMNATNNISIFDNADSTYFCIERISGPAQIAASEFYAPTTTKYTSGSGNYTVPTSPRAVKYIKVKMVGGGGGGCGSGTGGGSSTNLGDGGDTTFGTTTAGKGAKAVIGTPNVGGAGGTATLGAGYVGTAIAGGSGEGGSFTALAVSRPGGIGGCSNFGGAGMSGMSAGGGAATTNSGSGGGGGGIDGTINVYTGSGGGTGAFVEAYFSPTVGQVIAYAVGAAGGGGNAGVGGYAGGAGGSGYIEITEYYN